MTSINAEQWLVLKRIARFGDTDAAGVMHFHHLLSWCHEAWEESIENYGLPVDEIFPNCNLGEEKIDVLLPIVHCEADFRLPVWAGDHLTIRLFPKKIDGSSFEVKSRFQKNKEDIAVGVIRHIAINSQTRQRCALPNGIERWIEASSLSLGLRPL